MEQGRWGEISAHSELAPATVKSAFALQAMNPWPKQHPVPPRAITIAPKDLEQGSYDVG